MNDEFEPIRRPPRRLRRIAISIGCIVLGIVGGLVVFGLIGFRRPPPAMSAADFEAAVARWEAHRPADYEMDVKVLGRQSGMMHVVVKNHAPVSVRRGGAPVAEHTWEYWTVEGLFEIIRTDLEGMDQPERAFGTPDVSQLVQQAEFDAELGYPRRYRRAVLTTGDAIEWEITEFKREG
ncbi:MAG: DUF6174 domain-containing protein [Pirellulales bacterium]